MSETSLALRAIKDLQHIRLDGLRFRLIDAKGQVVGRLAQQIAVILQGKDKPTYNPKKDQGDVVIVINAAHVRFTYDKWDTKLYRWHTGYPGGLRQRTATEQWEKNPTKILQKAVSGMLPKNKTRDARLDKLKIFPEAEHPFTDFPLVPYVPPLRTFKDTGLGWSLPQGFDAMNSESYAFRLMTSQRLQGRERPIVDITDLLTEDERRALEGKQQQLGGSTATTPEQEQQRQQQRKAKAAQKAQG